jgi:hypothetical protein
MSRLDSATLEVMFYEGLLKKNNFKFYNNNDWRAWDFYQGLYMDFFRLVFTEDIEHRSINCRSFS